MRDHERMLREINAVFESDIAESLVDHRHWLDRGVQFTQAEAEEMSRMLGRIYTIAHGIDCSCGDKYEISKLAEDVPKAE